jgi:hypothetical protein
MRTHFLKDLEIDGKEKVLQFLPGFDFYKLQRLVKLGWGSWINGGGQQATSNLEMTLGYESELVERAEITLRFVEVARCKLPELLPLVYFSEIEIEDIKRAQREGIRYLVKNYGTTELEIECKDVEIKEWKSAD